MEKIDNQGFLTIENSTALNGVKYDSASRKLWVRFHTGKVWEYSDVPPSTFVALYNSDSRGSYYTSHIRGQFKSREIVPGTKGASLPTGVLEQLQGLVARIGAVKAEATNFHLAATSLRDEAARLELELGQLVDRLED